MEFMLGQSGKLNSCIVGAWRLQAQQFWALDGWNGDGFGTKKLSCGPVVFFV